MSTRPHRLRCLLFLAAILFYPACQGQRPPYSPRESLQSFELPPGFRIELVAAEPEVVDPVAMAFDARGRLFVVEMPDYPMGKRRGRIKLLEDKDDDGRFERSTLFAQDLQFPNGVMPWRGGILVTSAPEILYLEDTNGDNRADLRRVVLTGFAALNPQLRLNGLQYGIDNWIYGAYPKFGMPNRYVKEFGDLGAPIRFPERPEIPPVDIFGKGMDFRFKPDEAKLEPVAGNSQFGNAFDSWGNRFTVWHNNHVRHVVIQSHYLLRNPYLPIDSAMQSLSDHGNAATVYPITAQPLHIHESEIGHFTSSCGISVYEGGSFPLEYQGAYFVCEPVHNLVHCDILSPSGATFLARRAQAKTEFLASTDSWFRPVFTTVGPDGALYVVDFYRKVVEHPEWIPPEMMNEADLYAGNDRGRIYRVVHEATKPALIPKLNSASASELVQQISSPNMCRRLTAQRLLIERQDRSIIPQLQDLARRSTSAQGRLHALWTLEGLESLDVALVFQALDDAVAAVREHAIRLAENKLSHSGLREKLLQMANDPDKRVQFQLACTLGQLSDEQSFKALQQIAFRHMEDSWFRIAVLSAASQNAIQWFRAVIARTGQFEEQSPSKQQFLRQITSIIGARERDAESTEVLGVVAQGRSEKRAWWKEVCLDGLAEGLKRGAESRTKLSFKGQGILIGLLQNRSPGLRKSALHVAVGVELADLKQLRDAIAKSAEIAAVEAARLEDRVDALGLLGLDPSGSTLPILEKLLDPRQPEQIQVAAASALLALREPRAIAVLLDKWKTYTSPVREVVLAGFFNERTRLPALLDAIEAGKVQAWSLSTSRRNQLLRFPIDEIRRRTQPLLSNLLKDDRKQALDKFRPAVRLAGNVERGKSIFKELCSKCHRIGDAGFEVGPDLASLTNRTRENLLTQILDPNAYVAPGYEEYAVETIDGRWITGVMAKETATTITLRRGEGEEDTILRRNVASLRSLNVSQMPEDLEKGISLQDMADLLQYLKVLGTKSATSGAH